MKKKKGSIIFCCLIVASVSLNVEAATTQLFSVLGIVPSSYNIKIEKGIQLDTPVEFSTYRDWQQQLGESVNSAGLDYTFDACLKEIRIYRKKHVVMTQHVELQNNFVGVATSNPSDIIVKPESPVLVNRSIAASETKKESPSALKSAVWRLQAGDTIKTSLETWAKTVGWHIVWDLQRDWSVPSTTTYTGSFDEVAGQVIKTLSSNGALIHAKFYLGNQSMVVTGVSE
jgi:hypothetical protein